MPEAQVQTKKVSAEISLLPVSLQRYVLSREPTTSIVALLNRHTKTHHLTDKKDIYDDQSHTI